MSNGICILRNLGQDAKKVFSIIQKKGPLTKSQLLLMTGMKLTTLNRIMEPLEKCQLVIEVDIAESTGGRKPVLYDANTEIYYVIGIDISRILTQVIVADLKMNVLGQHQFSMTSECTPETTVKLISIAVGELLVQLNIDKKMILGAGLGTVGPIDRNAGVMIHPANFEAPGWTNVQIKNMIESEINLPVFIDNGANTAVLAEFLYGEGRNFESVAYFNCGMGIRTGAISSGNIVRTLNDAEDAFGHMIIDMDGVLCNCGNYGCIECYSSIHSITKKFISLYKMGRVSNILKPVEKISYIDICKAAEEDELAKEVITDGAAVFGLGLANYINLLNPGLVILSGPLIKHSSLFYKLSIEAALKKRYIKEGNRIVFSRGGHFKDYAISIGSAAVVVENYLKNKVE